MNHAAMLLDEVLGPISHLLADPGIEDVAINEPGAAWARGPRGWVRHEAPSLDFDTLEGVAVLAGSLRQQDVGRTNPMIGGDLHTGHRYQAVLPPAVPGGTVNLTFRRPSDRVSALAEVPNRYDTSRWNQWAKRDDTRRHDSAALLDLYDAGDVVGFLRAIVRTRRTPLLCGPTGSGKTFLSKSLLSEVDPSQRVVTIEDALEMVVQQPNRVRLLFTAGGDGTVSPGDCLHAALRMRPDLVPVQELREPHSAWVYLNEVATGHPGSPTTIHGETAGQAVRRLFALLKGSAEGASISDDVLLGMIGSALDVVVPIGTDGAARHLGEIWFSDDAHRRGETVADLMRAA